MENAVNVANKIVKISLDDNNPITPLKLQKILYLAHGLHLAFKNEPLFAEPVEAWDLGPVVADVYHTFKYWGSNNISKVPLPGILVDNKFIYEEVSLAAASAESVTNAWNAGKNITAVQLSNWTHEPKSPWTAAYNSSDRNKIIENEKIREYFLNQLTIPNVNS